MMFSLLFSRERLMEHLRQATGLATFDLHRMSHHRCGTVPESHRTSLTNMHRDYCRGISEGSRRVKPAMQDDADRRDAVD